MMSTMILVSDVHTPRWQRFHLTVVGSHQLVLKVEITSPHKRIAMESFARQIARRIHPVYTRVDVVAV
jgi:hypothetical protein